ncbi:MAG TPA: hypothetical protein VLV86_23660, partial [Vicinamibacterales bacterium]|nr:hypothetical protein [Vicinamibacterales bacterium]
MRSLCAMVCGVLLIAVTASAQTVTITSGSVFLYWDGSLSGFQLSAPGTQLVGEVLQGSAVILQDGAVADLSHTVSAYTNSNHPFTEQVNGTTYPSVWIRASLSFTATPLYVPGGTDGALTSFSTPFTMSGQFAGFSDQAMTQQVFSVSLQGAGIITVGTLRQFAGSGSGAWALIGQGGTAFGFTSALPSPWTAADVGNVGTAGVSSYSNGEFYVAGAGSDIWGNADAFQFVSQPLAGDGSIVAQLDGLDLALSPFAKAGVMIRQSMSADSAHVLLDVKPDGGVELLTRSAAGGATTFVAGATVTGRPWLRLTRSGSAVTAALSPDGSTWTTVGSATLGGNALIGLAVTSHSTAYLDQAQFEQVTVTSAGAGGSLPLSWSQADVGVVGQAGSGSAVGGTFTVAGSGSDIWGSADAFHYVYTSDQGSGSIVARVVSVSDTNTFAKAGIMFRNSLDAGATHVILDVRPDGSLEFMTRSTSGQATTFIASAQTTFPVTLKLERTSGPVDSLFVASFLDPGG